MAHQRQTIREAVKALLVGVAPDHPTAAGANVFETRVVPWKGLRLPAIAVYTLKETVDPESRNTAPRELRRTVQLVVEGAVKAGTNVDDAMDGLAAQVERVMHADPTFGGAASDSILADTEGDVDAKGDELVGYVRITYSVTYYTGAPEAADVPLPDDFETAHVRTNLGGDVHPDNEAVDDVTVPTT